MSKDTKQKNLDQIEMLDEQIERDVIHLFKAFSNQTRIRILFALKCKKLTVSEISEVLSMSHSAISHQLRELKLARLVTYKKRGREIVYELDDHHVHDIFDIAIEHVKEIYKYE
ncbi:MAG TPA: metalloregulator ArsR/SmtB family transcription factor [Pseudogracilibacillus sp.]|nr:metalloregulator ArsR/SmtB family transcription factor [Pseudogracilibacillus sp.]